MFSNRKKVLFVCYGLGIGGIEKCLVNLLNVLPEEKFDIDVLLMNPEIDLTDQIKQKVKYIDSFKYVMNTTDTMREIKEYGGVFKNLKKFLSYCVFRLRVKLRLNAWKTFRKLPEHYDIAIAYSQNDYSPYYVIDKVSADRKILWYHNGSYDRTGKKYLRDQKYYKKFDYVVAVSSDCKAVLENKFEFKDGQLIVLRNICDVGAIISKSNEFYPDSFYDGLFHIVTVGRLTVEKGADLAVEACRELSYKIPNICWHWVGDGNQREYIEEKIKHNSLEKNFILEGDQVNPYPFMKSADIYVQPSYYEAYSTTITEARVLCKPIITTDVGGMRDQLLDEVTGLVVPVNRNALVKAIYRLFKDNELRFSFSKNLSSEKVDSELYLKEYFESIFK